VQAEVDRGDLLVRGVALAVLLCLPQPHYHLVDLHEVASRLIVVITHHPQVRQRLQGVYVFAMDVEGVFECLLALSLGVGLVAKVGHEEV